ncbi:mannitol dehydrogenase [Candidatus Epulonipiscium fishelsonii]|uniref:Mannitol dehydrogenase n=1 Tax=Candidatus Epulonipiscium fishelsonii TaxID=77094 RepID=A0ACC8XI07_9FIRM|nr:mannitol dehydrogenase [Epulopiscium sp. SCG-D08WGA-EpuloA1]
MKLNYETLQDKAQWEKEGFELPKFDIKQIKENTLKNPAWVHFGAGNLFRAFIANVQQDMINKGKSDKGIIAVEGFDYEIIQKTYHPMNNLGVVVTLKADGDIDKTIVGSVVESLVLNSAEKSSWDKLKQIFSAPSLQMASFTITEKGYSLQNAQGEYFASVENDFENGPEAAVSYIGKVAALLYTRYVANKAPIAMVSMDNCSHNGDKLFNAVVAYAKAWEKNGLVEKGFYDYITDKDKVSFPWTMIDKITPRPDEKVKAMLQKSGFDDVETIVTAKNTFVAPFVNAEEAQYLVVEDWFPNGRPNLEEAGIIFTDRETVDKVEKMKVCTCLNPLHTALAIFGCLLDFKLICDEMNDQDLKSLVEKIGYDEGLPVVVDPKIIEPKQFIDEVLQKRVTNPFMPDTPQRIATDTSQKLGIRFGETIKAYVQRNDLDVKSLKFIPLVLAGWCRYLMAVDDNGNKMELSPDPMLPEVLPYFKDVTLGYTGDVHKVLQPVLSNTKIFGVNVYDVELGEKVEDYFKQLISGVGAVRATLKKYL